MIVFVILFFAIAYSCTAQEDRRIKQGDMWYSLGLQVCQNETDTILLYSLFYPTAYQFSGIGISIKSKQQCIGKATMIVTYESGITDYIGCFGEINCEGNTFFRLNDTELQHFKNTKIKQVQINNPLYGKTYDLDMSKFRSDWFVALLKQ